MDKMNDATIKIANLNEIIKSERLIAKTGDTKGRDLYVQLVNKNEKGLNTEGVRLTLAYKTPSGIINEIPFVPVNEEEGLYGLTYDAGLTHEAGVVTATIRLKTYDTTTETPNFEIYVEGSPLEGIHFSEVDGLTFKKVMDKVDDIELRANLIEEDILHIDRQIQDMNTRIVYVEEEDGLEERVYNNENDIVMLTEEVERLETELSDLRVEIDNIEVGEGSGGSGGTTEQDTGWRILVTDSRLFFNFAEVNIYIRRKGNKVYFYGDVKSTTEHTNNSLHISSFGYTPRSTNNGFPEMFRSPENSPTKVGIIPNVGKDGNMLRIGSYSYMVDRVEDEQFELYIYGGTKGIIDYSYYTDRPFTDEYMDLPLVDVPVTDFN